MSPKPCVKLSFTIFVTILVLAAPATSFARLVGGWGRDGLPELPKNPQKNEVFAIAGPRGTKNKVLFTGNPKDRFEVFVVAQKDRWYATLNRFTSNVRWRSEAAETSIERARPFGAPPPAGFVQNVQTFWTENRARLSSPSEWSVPSEWPRAQKGLRGLRYDPLKDDLFDKDAKNAVADWAKNSLDKKSNLNRDLEKGQGFVAQTTAYAITFGIVAFVKLHMDYPNNPMALSEFKNSLLTPSSAASFLGYTLAFKMAHGMLASPHPQTFGQVMGPMTAGIGAGLLTSYAIMTMANDPEIDKCLGFAAYRKKGVFETDAEACGVVTSRPHVAALTMQVLASSVPATAIQTASYAGIVAAGPVIQRLVPSMTFWSNLHPVLRSVALLIVLSSFTTPLTEASTAWLGRLDATVSPFDRGTYARTTSRAEKDLLAAWARAKASGWSDPSDVSQTKDVCYDAERTGAPYFPCDQKTVADFAGALDAFQRTQFSWRQQLQMPTLRAFNRWSAKVMGYRQMQSAARNFYENASYRIAFTLKHPEASADDPRGFTAKTMNLPAPVPDLPFMDTFDGTWTKVFTPALNDYLMASMACGPEIEHTVERSAFGRVRRVFSRYVTGNYSPGELIGDPRGFASQFRPPRLTNPLPGTSETVCDNVSVPFDPDALWNRVPTSLWTPLDWVAKHKSTVGSFFVRSQNKNYRGLPDYIARNVRDTVIAPDGTNTFAAWWAERVEPQNRRFNQRVKRDYNKMLVKRFIPALTSRTYQYCAPSPQTTRTHVERYLSELSDGTEACRADRTHRLAHGLVDNLRDEARLYLALAMDLYVSNPEAFHSSGAAIGDSGGLEATARASARALLEAFDRFEVVFTRLAEREELSGPYAEVKAAFAHFADVVLPPDLVIDRGDGADFKREWMYALLLKITGDLGGLESYMSIMTAGSVESL